jgi:glyoxylase-like metal-dependent hydrolase (beta-lactamase superfamily II)
MRIHHLDCGPFHPLGGRLMDGVSPGLVGRLTCHCLAIETARHGVVLVDTGLGLRDMLRPYPRLPWWNAAMLRPRFDPERAVIRRLKSLGLEPSDVRHIVMTHLDFDHAGGLIDFPQAKVHLTSPEAEAAVVRRGLLGRTRYRPAQWGDTRRWHSYETRLGRRGRGSGETWFGLRDVRELDGLPPEILLVPLPGHSAGHAGVAIQSPRGWMLHAGDAYFNRAEVHGGPAAAAPPRCPPGVAAYERIMAEDKRERRETQARVRTLANDPLSPVVVFCTHDPVEFVAMAAWSEGTGAPERAEPIQGDAGTPLSASTP